MGGFADTILSVLLGWVTGVVQWLFALFNGGGGGGVLAWFGKNWLPIAGALIGAGLVVDWVVWLIRWQPYHIWAKRARKLGRVITGKPEPEPEPDVQATMQYVPVRGQQRAADAYRRRTAAYDEDAYDEEEYDEEYEAADEAWDEDDDAAEDDRQALAEAPALRGDERVWQTAPGRLPGERAIVRGKLPPPPDLPDEKLGNYPGRRYDPDILPTRPQSRRVIDPLAAYDAYDLDDVDFQAEPTGVGFGATVDDDEAYDDEAYDDETYDDEAYDDEENYDDEDDYDNEDFDDDAAEANGAEAADEAVNEQRRRGDVASRRDVEFAAWQDDAEHLARQRALYGRPQDEPSALDFGALPEARDGHRRRRSERREQPAELFENVPAPRQGRRRALPMTPDAPRFEPRPEPRRANPPPEPVEPEAAWDEEEDWDRIDLPNAPRWQSWEARPKRPETSRGAVPARPSMAARMKQFAEARLSADRPQKRGKLAQFFDPQEEAVKGLPPRVDKEQVYGTPTYPQPREEIHQDWEEDE